MTLFSAFPMDSNFVSGKFSAHTVSWTCVFLHMVLPFSILSEWEDHIFRYPWARSFVLSDRPHGPMNRSFHNSLLINPSAVQLTRTSTLSTEAGKVFNETPFLHRTKQNILFFIHNWEPRTDTYEIITFTRERYDLYEALFLFTLTTCTLYRIE